MKELKEYQRLFNLAKKRKDFSKLTNLIIVKLEKMLETSVNNAVPLSSQIIDKEYLQGMFSISNKEIDINQLKKELEDYFDYKNFYYEFRYIIDSDGEKLEIFVLAIEPIKDEWFKNHN